MVNHLPISAWRWTNGQATHAAWDQHGGGNHRDTVTHLGQRNERVRSRALQKHAGSNVHDVTCRVEPLARSEAAVEQKQWLIRQVRDVEHMTPTQPVLAREHGQIVDGIPPCRHSIYNAGL